VPHDVDLLARAWHLRASPGGGGTPEGSTSHGPPDLVL